MGQKRVAIACQGGGSQCAFVAGALRALLQRGVRDHYKIVGLSGTSGGAINATLAWLELLRQEHDDKPEIGERIIACWKDLTAQTPLEMMIDGTCVELLRLVERGLLPNFASTPSSLPFQLWSRAVSGVINRPEFTDLRALLTKHLALEDVPSLLDADSPVLLVGAADILEGTFKVFSSANHEITIDAVLASAAIPTLFPAAWVGQHAYWDGIFSTNPPVVGFLRETLMGPHAIPEEIWIIQVNRTRSDFIPERPSDIFDRRNQLAGNLSLQHELEVIDMINMLLRENALTDAFRARFRLEMTEAITVRFLRMSEDLQRGLDYPSKLTRQPAHIARLIADGEAQALTFLSTLHEVSPTATTFAEEVASPQTTH